MRYESDHVGDAAVNPGERMWEGELAEDSNAVPFTDGNGHCFTIAVFVGGHDQRTIERGQIKRAGSVATMMVQRYEPSRTGGDLFACDAQVIELTPEQREIIYFVIAADQRSAQRKPRT